MKIEQPGQYRTSFKHMAVVTDIRRQWALGWVEREGKYKPTSWEVNGGTVWNGDFGDDLVAPWDEPKPAPPAFRIEKPGHYRARDNRRLEVVAVRDGYAVGFDSKVPLTWLADGRHWNWASGTGGSDQSLAIVSEWSEPIQQTVTFALVERQAGSKVVWERNIGLSNVLAIRTITITEGEGMP